MIPIRDENPTLHQPVVTIVIIAANIFIWFFVQGAGSELGLAQSLCHYGLIPGELLGSVTSDTKIQITGNYACLLGDGGSITTLVSHAFLHGSWFHLIANMWFLWIFGDNVEDVMDKWHFVFFYLMCAFAAAMAQILTAPGAVTPMVGASGAIGGVMGAYARLYPKAEIQTVIPIGFYITSASVPAAFMLGYWFLLQVLSGLPALGGSTGGVAFWAHVGGFVTGLVLIGPLHRPDYLAAQSALSRNQRSNFRF
ncbi:rhomboid family intramembrane serine protease [Methylicorpusculum sp.]|uniref:rhomboid family intramembrane serine protease n=1 Tax=Methylicorpusculum sp. TaxID=2713644 RepID=UPI002722C43B|nr:rhomboid family intramembrane serine protease [Methylicorpusculum sp.]MDO8845015.1 rhomboid family intramembrane serine protease [Methylicorpusculum sp.]MDP2180424.1 rhomboid family intramembrane serine protease [Methylicorpusculum sp.]MDP3530823.1 rhomboid family intramembrane serine protease [Methylicorpusculum sp.]MDZ4153394.1 rhomboid family intramembrane serine protease [Methylicorpusculum sp.]